MVRKPKEKDWLKTFHYYFPDMGISLLSLSTIQPGQHSKQSNLAKLQEGEELGNQGD